MEISVFGLFLSCALHCSSLTFFLWEKSGSFFPGKPTEMRVLPNAKCIPNTVSTILMESVCHACTLTSFSNLPTLVEFLLKFVPDRGVFISLPWVLYTRTGPLFFVLPEGLDPEPTTKERGPGRRLLAEPGVVKPATSESRVQ